MSPELFFPPQLNTSASFAKHLKKTLENNSETHDEDFKHPILKTKQTVVQGNPR